MLNKPPRGIGVLLLGGKYTTNCILLRKFLCRPTQRGSCPFSNSNPTLAASRKERGTALRWGYMLSALRA